MKIEKINDNQIRCTLTRADLASRHLKLSELAYGTEKAKSLFREMMQQASFEYGFDAEEGPLMIEAVPLSSDSLLLIVTKVEYPDELDTRFSQFTEGLEDDDYDIVDDVPQFSSTADDIFRLFQKAKDAVAQIGQNADTNLPTEGISSVDITKAFLFDTLEDLLHLSHILSGYYTGDNTLYKNPANGLYYLVVHKSAHEPETFNRICNILTEYGSQIDFSYAQDGHFAEHYETIVAHDALATLAQI